MLLIHFVEESPDRPLDIETIDQNVNLANVKLEVCDDFDMTTPDRSSSPGVDNIEQKYSYRLLDSLSTAQSHSRGRGAMTKSRGRGGGQRGRPVCDFFIHFNDTFCETT